MLEPNAPEQHMKPTEAPDYSDVNEAAKRALDAVDELAKERHDGWLFEFSQLLSEGIHSDAPTVRANATATLIRTLTLLIRGAR